MIRCRADTVTTAFASHPTRLKARSLGLSGRVQLASPMMEFRSSTRVRGSNVDWGSSKPPQFHAEAGISELETASRFPSRARFAAVLGRRPAAAFAQLLPSADMDCRTEPFSLSTRFQNPLCTPHRLPGRSHVRQAAIVPPVDVGPLAPDVSQTADLAFVVRSGQHHPRRRVSDEGDLAGPELPLTGRARLEVLALWRSQLQAQTFDKDRVADFLDGQDSLTTGARPREWPRPSHARRCGRCCPSGRPQRRWIQNAPGRSPRRPEGDARGRASRNHRPPRWRDGHGGALGGLVRRPPLDGAFR